MKITVLMGFVVTSVVITNIKQGDAAIIRKKMEELLQTLRAKKHNAIKGNDEQNNANILSSLTNKRNEGKPQNIPPSISKRYEDKRRNTENKHLNKRNGGKPEDLPPHDNRDVKNQQLPSVKRNKLPKDQYSSLELHKEWEIQRSMLKHKRTLVYPRRQGSSSNTQSCSEVRAVPDDLRQAMKINKYYQQYTETYGIPVMAPSSVQPDALRRLCYVANVMFADNKQLRDSYYQIGGYFMVWKSSNKEVPDWVDFDLGIVAGLGPIMDVPVTGLGEDDILCTEKSNFRYDREDVAIHEVGHTLDMTLYDTKAYNNWVQRLVDTYDKAMQNGLWRDKKGEKMYAATNHKEYFAEGVERYFNAAAKGETPKNKEELRSYDPEFYSLIEEIFPCNNKIINLCEQNRAAEQQHMQSLSRNCAQPAPPVVDLPPGPECRQTEIGTEYHGTTTVSGAGNACKEWFDDDAWVSFPPGEIDHKNYCRNPDNDPKGPWCYLADENIASYEYCNIPMCSDIEGPTSPNPWLVPVGDEFSDFFDELSNILGDDSGTNNINNQWDNGNDWGTNNLNSILNNGDDWDTTNVNNLLNNGDDWATNNVNNNGNNWGISNDNSGSDDLFNLLNSFLLSKKSKVQ